MKENELRRVELAAQVAHRLGLNKELVAQVVTTTLEEIGVALGQGKRVRLAGFGIFELRAYPARMGVHPRTGEPMPYPERWAPSFRAGQGLKRQVREGPHREGGNWPADKLSDRLRHQQEAVAAGERGEALDDVARRLSLD